MSEYERRPDLDQVRHHVERLYEQRHGERTELGGFKGRLTLRDEARLHDAHRRLNGRAERLAAPELRSPLTPEALANRSADELAKIVKQAQDLVNETMLDVDPPRVSAGEIAEGRELAPTPWRPRRSGHRRPRPRPRLDR